MESSLLLSEKKIKIIFIKKTIETNSRTAVNMLAVAEMYSFTTFSSLFRIAATTRPPILLNMRPSIRNTCTCEETEVKLVRRRSRLRSGGECSKQVLVIILA